MISYGFIYIRSHSSYNINNACKLGKTNNILERDAVYATGEIRRGYFESVFEVALEKMSFIERLLQYEFKKYNIKYDAGTEFYNIKIISLIEPYFNLLGIKFRKLSQKEINDLVRINRIKNIFTPLEI